MASAETVMANALKDIAKELHELNKKLERIYHTNIKQPYSPDKRISKKEGNDEVPD